MNEKLLSRKWLFRVIGKVLSLVIMALYVGYPTAMAVVAILPEHETSMSPPDGFSEIGLVTADEVHLGAWYAEPQNGTVIILVHGAGSGRNSLYTYATMFHENGFGVLVLNLRGYGDSEGQINRLGWNGTLDIGAAVDFLIVDNLGGLGLSMGGEVLLGVASTYPEIQSIAADGATFRSVNDYISLETNRPLYRNFTHQVFSFMVSVFTGDQQPQPILLESIECAENTSFLFVAAGRDDTEITYNQLFYQTAYKRSVLWIIPDVGHTDGFYAVSHEYTERVVDFFNRAISDEVLLDGGS